MLRASLSVCWILTSESDAKLIPGNNSTKIYFMRSLSVHCIDLRRRTKCNRTFFSEGSVPNCPSGVADGSLVTGEKIGPLLTHLSSGCVSGG